MSKYTRIICFATMTDHGDPKANEEYVLNSHHQLGDKAVEVFNVPIAGVNIEDLYSATREALIKLESELITNTRKYIVMDVTTYYLMLSDPQAFTAIPHNTGLGEVKLFSATVLRCEDSWNFSCALRRSPDLCNVIANVNFEDITASKKSEKVDSDSVQAVTETIEESDTMPGPQPNLDKINPRPPAAPESYTNEPTDAPQSQPSAKKETHGKLRYDLIPVSSLEELCKVYTYGVEKYGDRNWEKGLPWLTCFAAIMRHLLSWVQGVDVDRESGCKHLAHVAWWCFALMWYARKGKGVDDRDKDSSAEGVVEFESVAVGEGTE